MRRETLNTAIILAGGKGDRLFPYTTVLPKPLLPINGKQIISYILEDLLKADFNDFIISVADGDTSLFENYLGESEIITYDATPLGYNTGGRLETALDLLEESTSALLHYGDIITNVDYKLLQEFHDENEAIATLVVKRGWNIPKGLVKSDDFGRVTDFIERYPLNDDIWTGVAMVDRKIGMYIDSPSDDIGATILPRLIEEDEVVNIFQFGGFFLDIGTQKDYKNAEEYLRHESYL